MLADANPVRGFTLVELMVATSIGLIAIASVLTVYAATVQHSTAQLNAAHLHQQLYGLLHLMSTDIRRAGYWHFDIATQVVSDNPFMTGQTRLQSLAYPEEHSNSCILFAYDVDKDGLVGIGQCGSKNCPDGTDEDNNEQFGFRLRNFSVQSRYGGHTIGCDSGYWQTVNEGNIEITGLGFSINTRCKDLLDTDRLCIGTNPGLIQQAVFVELAGQLVNQPATEIRLSRWVVVRNDILVDATE